MFSVDPKEQWCVVCIFEYVPPTKTNPAWLQHDRCLHKVIKTSTVMYYWLKQVFTVASSQVGWFLTWQALADTFMHQLTG